MIKSYRTNEIIIFWKAHSDLTSLLVKADAQTAPTAILLNIVKPQSYIARELVRPFSQDQSISQWEESTLACAMGNLRLHCSRSIACVGDPLVQACNLWDTLKTILQQLESRCRERPSLEAPIEVLTLDREFTCGEVFLPNKYLARMTACKNSAYCESCQLGPKTSTAANQVPGHIDVLLPRVLAEHLLLAVPCIMPAPTSPQKQKSSSDYFTCVPKQTGKPRRIVTTDLDDANNITRWPLITEPASRHLR